MSDLIVQRIPDEGERPPEVPVVVAYENAREVVLVVGPGTLARVDPAHATVEAREDGLLIRIPKRASEVAEEDDTLHFG